MRKFLFLTIVLLCCSLLSACSKTDETKVMVSREDAESNVMDTENMVTEEQQWEKGFNLPVDDVEKNEAVTDCKKMMKLILELYANADKGSGANVVIPSKTIYQMVEKVKETGYPVTTSETYFNMKNYRKLEDFLNSSMNGKSGEIVVYEVHSDGGIGRNKYVFDGTDMYVLSAIALWNNDNEFIEPYIAYTRIKEWKYSKKGWFCYELCVPEYPEVSEIVDGSRLIRVKPMSKEEREFSKKCVLGLGYQGNNLLCSNWNMNYMENLDFNGLYEYLYEMKYHRKLKSEDRPNGIPKDEFEQLIMEYLPITSDQLQEYAVFNKEKQTYEWVRLGCGNVYLTYFGTSVPEVTGVRKNQDGTITLTVDAVCEMILCDDAVITHELTVRVSEDGSFKYLGNQILNDGIKRIPDYHYRINREEIDLSVYQHTETPWTLDITAQKDNEGKLKFSVSIEEFISCYNEFYSGGNGTYYIQPCSEWYSCVEKFGKHTGDVHYEFTADKKMWTLPTIAVYTSEDETNIRELTVNFDTHSYSDKMYKQYEELCFYTLRVFFPELSEQKITQLYKKINELAYENIFQNEQGFNSDNPNPPCVLYYKNEIGVYPYFAIGESVRMCIIPVTEEVVQDYAKKGTVVCEIL